MKYNCAFTTIENLNDDELKHLHTLGIRPSVEVIPTLSILSPQEKSDDNEGNSFVPLSVRAQQRRRGLFFEARLLPMDIASLGHQSWVRLIEITGTLDAVLHEGENDLEILRLMSECLPC
jgi:hypothetical protein